MINIFLHIFMWLLTICVSLEESLVRCTASFLNGHFFFFYHWVISYLCVLSTSLSSDIWFANIFSYSVGCLFVLWWIKFFILIKSSLSVLSFCGLCFGVISRSPLPNPMSWRFASMFSFKTFVLIAFMFRSLIYSELIFIYGIM